MTATPVAPPAKPEAADVVAWHELECGAYRADLELWLELAGAARGPVLDVGAGSGRVALELARAGHEVVALDRDPDLLAALAASPGAQRVRTVCADARKLDIDISFALCLVPMQTIQLLGGPPGRARFLRRVRRHLRPGGVLAAALLPGQLDEFDVATGDAPAADRMQRDGVSYTSRPTKLRVEAAAVVIERQRERVDARGTTAVTHDTIRLDRLAPRQLEVEGARLGLAALSRRRIAATADHVGSEVVMLRA